MIAENIANIRTRLGDAKLIAVSKSFSEDKVWEALLSGQRVFGENRVQEAAAKFKPLRDKYTDIELHMIGALQSNKALAAVELFDVIQTLDRKSLADALIKAIKKIGKHPRIYIEVNIGCEPQKSGIDPDRAGEFLEYCQSIKLDVCGFMCIPPEGVDPVPFFKHMKEMQVAFGLQHLSMGMSGDFEQAIACGATEIRVGTSIFGDRAL